MAGHTLPSFSGDRLLGKIGLAAVGTLIAVIALLPRGIPVFARHTADIPAGVHLSVGDHLGSGSVLRHRRLQIPGQLEGLVPAHHGSVWDQFYCVHRETIFGQYVIPDQKTDQALFAAFIVFGTAEIPEVAAPFSRLLQSAAALAGGDGPFQLGHRPPKVLDGQLQHSVRAVKALGPAPVLQPQPPVHPDRDGTRQQRPQILGMPLQIVHQHFVTILVEEHRLVISRIHLRETGEERAEGHGKYVPVQDLLVLQLKHRHLDLARDHGGGVLVVGKVVGGQLGVGEDKGGGVPGPARAARTLDIVGWAGGHIPEVDRL